MLYCFLLVLHNSSSSSTSFLSLPCCDTTFFLLLLATVQDSSAIPLVRCGNPPSTLLLLGSQSCTFIKGPFRPSCIPFDETIETIFKPPPSKLSSTHVGVCVGCNTYRISCKIRGSRRGVVYLKNHDTGLQVTWNFYLFFFNNCLIKGGLKQMFDALNVLRRTRCTGILVVPFLQHGDLWRNLFLDFLVPLWLLRLFFELTRAFDGDG